MTTRKTPLQKQAEEPGMAGFAAARKLRQQEKDRDAKARDLELRQAMLEIDTEVQTIRFGSRFVSDKKPIFVRMGNRSGFKWEEYTVDITGSEFRIRPKGARRGGPAEVAVTVSAMYEKLLIARVEATRRAKMLAKRKGPRRVKRGAL